MVNAIPLTGPSLRPSCSEAPDLRLLGDEADEGGAEKVGCRKGAEDTTNWEIKPPCAALLLEVKVFVKHRSHHSPWTVRICSQATAELVTHSASKPPLSVTGLFQASPPRSWALQRQNDRLATRSSCPRRQKRTSRVLGRFCRRPRGYSAKKPDARINKLCLSSPPEGLQSSDGDTIRPSCQTNAHSVGQLLLAVTAKTSASSSAIKSPATARGWNQSSCRLS